MLRYALLFGLPIGAVTIAAIIASLSLATGESSPYAQAVGYLIMLVAFSMIFVAVRQFRDRQRDGVLGFWPAFGLGIAISVVAGLVYVVVWEAYLAATDHAFIQDYVTGLIEAKRAEGITGAALDAEIAELNEMVTQYGNPWVRLPITFSEIFPVGAVVSFIVALILRRRAA
ncbi:MAG: DUF4199 domain-containing protein [Pseudomonadota bacterium]